MYHAMTELGYAGESGFAGPAKLSAPPPGTSVLVLGAGIAGMVAAIELRDAGYKVQLLEYNGRAGGRNWSLYGGDTYTELGGFTQHVKFDPGQYINPGPWRLPYHHHGILHYASRLNVALEPFTQVNYNAYVHSTEANGGKPERYPRGAGGFQWPCRRASGQEHQAEGAGPDGDQGGSGDPAGGAEAMGRAGRQLRIQEEPHHLEPARLCRRIPAAG